MYGLCVSTQKSLLVRLPLKIFSGKYKKIDSSPRTKIRNIRVSKYFFRVVVLLEVLYRNKTVCCTLVECKISIEWVVVAMYCRWQILNNAIARWITVINFQRMNYFYIVFFTCNSKILTDFSWFKICVTYCSYLAISKDYR